MKVGFLQKYKELVIVSMFFAAMVLVFNYALGTILSGYHLVDDHEYLEWVYQMKCQGLGFWEVMGNKLALDLQMRYSPLYYMMRVTQTYFFGVELAGYAAVKSIMIWLMLLSVYYWGKEMGAESAYAMLFTLISLVGYQGAIWWKLGTHEPQGIILLAVGSCCLLKYLKLKKKGFLAGCLFSYFMMCNYKECFMVLLPFVMLYILYFDLEQAQGELSVKKIWNCIWKRMPTYVPIAVVFLVPLGILLFGVGIGSYNGFGTAGGGGLIDFAAYERSLETDLKWYKRFGVLFIMILLTFWEPLKKLWKEMLLTLSFMIPLIVLYGKSGMTERYILPCAIGFAFFFVIVVPKSKILSGKRKILYVMGLVLLLAAHTRGMLREADYFRYRGESVQAMLDTVLEVSNQDKKILSCLAPNTEANLTVQYYLLHQNAPNVYYWFEEKGTVEVQGDPLAPDFGEVADVSLEDMDMIVMYNKEDRHWCYEPTIDLSDYTEVRSGTLSLYVKDGSGIEIPDLGIQGLRINF